MDIKFEMFVKESNAVADAKLEKANKIADNWFVAGIKLSEWTEDAKFIEDHCFGDAVGNDISDLVNNHDVSDDEYTEMMDMFVDDVTTDIEKMRIIVETNFAKYA